jgi:hypothetical protein
VDVRAGVEQQRPALNFYDPILDLEFDAGPKQYGALCRRRGQFDRFSQRLERPPFGTDAVARAGSEGGEGRDHTRNVGRGAIELTLEALPRDLVKDKSRRHDEARTYP